MSIHQLPTVQSYWKWGQFTGNEEIRDTMTRQWFKDILRNLHILNKEKNDNNGKGFKIPPVTNLLKTVFLMLFPVMNCIKVDEMHMAKCKGRSSIKQYIKKKPFKWGFKFWYHCANSTGYLYQPEIYLGKKNEVERNFAASAILKMYKGLEKSYCTVYFDNFFNSHLLI